MRKSLALLFCLGLCLTLAFLYPRTGSSNPAVDDTGCLECHDASFPGGETSLHVIHTGQDCTICHAVTGDTPATSKCIVCHPVGDAGTCPLVNQHETAGADCLTCHSGCAQVTTTTTTADVTTTTTTAQVTTTTTSVPATGDIEVSPERIFRSRWVVIPALLAIRGTGAEFDRRTSKPSYSPDNALIPLPSLQLGADLILQTVLVKPEWWALAGNQTVTVTVDGSSADFDIELLPFILDK